MRLFQQPAIPPTPPHIDLTGQTIVVTGATRGLGYEASLQLLRLKASVLYLGVRDVDGGIVARATFLRDSEVRRANPNAVVKVLRLDLEDFKSVVDFADEIIKDSERLDVLLLNAGINRAHFEKTKDGHEILTQVNFLSNALLGLLLLPLLQKTSNRLDTTKDGTDGLICQHQPVITWVGSLAHAFTSLSRSPLDPSTPILPCFSEPSFYSRIHRYADTKLFVALFVREMAKRLPLPLHFPLGAGEAPGAVVVNNLCPGTVNTSADDMLPLWLRVPMSLNRWLRARSVQEGARTLIHACEVTGPESHGQYLSSNEVNPLAPFADTRLGTSFAEKLWDETVAECVRIDIRCTDGLRTE